MIVFDIGANGAENSVKLMKEKGYVVYAFEPVKASYDFIVERTKEYRDKYHVFNIAVSDFNGTVKLNIQTPSKKRRNKKRRNNGLIPAAASSLLEIEEKHIDIWNNIKCSNSAIVKAIRLDTFIEQHNIEYIDFLHCDAQGSDLKIIESLGKYVGIVRGGVVEAAKDISTTLYKDQNLLKYTQLHLESQGFQISKVEPNDSQRKEVNINFFRPGYKGICKNIRKLMK